MGLGKNSIDARPLTVKKKSVKDGKNIVLLSSMGLTEKKNLLLSWYYCMTTVYYGVWVWVWCMYG